MIFKPLLHPSCLEILFIISLFEIEFIKDELQIQRHNSLMFSPFQLLLFSTLSFFPLVNLSILYSCFSLIGNAFQEVPGSSILKALSTLRKQGFSSLPHYYLRAGSALLVRNIVVLSIIPFRYFLLDTFFWFINAIYIYIVCRILFNPGLLVFLYLPKSCSVSLMIPVKKHFYAEQQCQCKNMFLMEKLERSVLNQKT